MSEPEAIASVDKAAKDSPDNSKKNQASIAPKTKAGMINAMVNGVMKHGHKRKTRTKSKKFMLKS